MTFNNNFSHNKKSQFKYKPTRTKEKLPMWFSMKLETGSIYACSDLEHAFAVSCRHSKCDGFGTWVPCYRDINVFCMPDIVNRDLPIEQ